MLTKVEKLGDRLQDTRVELDRETKRRRMSDGLNDLAKGTIDTLGTLVDSINTVLDNHDYFTKNMVIGTKRKASEDTSELHRSPLKRKKLDF